MDRQRTRDRLTGAAVAVAVLLVLLLASLLGLLWWASEPAGPGPAATQVAPRTSPERLRPPDDLVDGETWLDVVVLDAARLTTVDTRLQDVRAVARDVRAAPDGARAGSVRVEATVPYDVVARELGSGIVVRRSGSRVQVLRTVEVAGRRLQASATGDVTVVDGRLVVVPRTIDVGGPEVLSRRLADVVRSLTTIEQDVEGVPEGLVLQRVTVRDDGFLARLEGTDVLLLP